MKKLYRNWLTLIILGVAIIISMGSLEKIKADRVDAKAAYMIDAGTGQVLYQQNANNKYPIASLTKILTLAVIMKDIHNQKLNWDQKIKVNKDVADMANNWQFSNVQLNEGESYTVRSLVESMMIVSADGSTEALALADAGNIQAFNEKMKEVAREAGVTDAEIYNMIGLPNSDLGKLKLKNVDDNQENKFSAKDIALISKYLVNNYPEVIDITKQKNVDFKISADQTYNMENINYMLEGSYAAPKNGTIDGLKTGFTDDAGYCFVGTGTFNGQRVITVILNTSDYNKQFAETNKMIESVMNNDKVVNTKDIKSVKQALKKENLKVNDTNIWVAKHTDPKQIKAKLTLANEKIKAKNAKNEKVGTIKISSPGVSTTELNVNLKTK
ncbi:D-alanyl-D-alanine carboxypeptidase family protein [Ligilactobacillus salivarius]|uniref:D-alanyl-D-alanine carboxypeptidase family protein n=1 Tax=Ligilactobacillus salivarius TaxID=1624 RepID=UPI0020234623|nr:serine hydrolase [Ligilactobacillus salivarius]URI12695.1 serine hydrolase [Ligilactobacillus salivarius]UUB34520.1 serine hydrolase [Ligilactobacillus salivarius]